MLYYAISKSVTPSKPSSNQLIKIMKDHKLSFLFILSILVTNVTSRVTSLSKDQVACTMCDVCDNPCQPPVIIPSPPPPPPPVIDTNCPPPPSQPQPQPPSQPQPTTPSVPTFAYYSPPPPFPTGGSGGGGGGGYGGGGGGYSYPTMSTPPPNPIVPYYPYYYYNPPPSRDHRSASFGLEINPIYKIIFSLILSLEFLVLFYN